MRTSFAALCISLALCGVSAAADGVPAERVGEPLPTFEETCFQTRPAGGFIPPVDAQRMLEGIGRESRLSPGDHEKVRLRGLFRIRDWTPETALRVALVEPGSQLRIHAWGEGHGVSLFLGRADAAYRITQQPGEAMTKQDVRLGLASLVTTDDRRGARLPPGGAYQIRCQAGAIVVTKGDVRLMTVPLEGPAKALYIEVPGSATLRDLALLRTGPVPEEIPPAHRIVLDGRQASQLPWKEMLPKAARFRKLGDGCVELAAENTAETAMATVAVAGPGLYEVTLEVDDATPGTGIALLNAKGEPLDGIEFARELKTKLAFGYGTPREPPSLSNFDFTNSCVPLAGPRQWLRLVLTGGSSKCWISGDGVHWGRALDGRGRYGAWQSIALYARETNGDRKNPDNVARHIRLRSLQVRELSGLTTAVAADLLAKAATTAGVAMKVDQHESPQAWTERIARLAPAGASPTAWRYACTLQALAAPVDLNVAERLLERAVRERLSELRSTRAKIDLLLDAALVWRSGSDTAQRQLELWDQLGRELLNAGGAPGGAPSTLGPGVRGGYPLVGAGPADFALYQQAIIQASLSDAPERSGPISWELARDATMLFYVEHREANLGRMEKLLLFWRAANGRGEANNPPQLGNWPVAQQLDQLLLWLNVRPAGRGRRRQSAVVDVARAVTPPLNRSATNILSELQSTLDGQQYADAARILVTCNPPQSEGLVPAADDDQLFLSFRAVLRMVMLEHPELGEAMARQIGPADRLKIEQVMAQGDPAAVETLPLQYCGSPAAAAPCQWLGDRALAGADLAQAMSWYDDGLHWASPAQKPDLAARMRLAAAMLGLAQGQPPTQPVSFGGITVPPERFEGWIRNQLSRRKTATEVAGSADSLPVVAAAQPVLSGTMCSWSAATFGQLNDAAGRGFGRETMPRELPEEFYHVDWSWRHLTLRAGEDSLLAVERSRITAFDLQAGKVRWDYRLRNGWSLGPVRPLVCGQRIYIRAVTTAGRAGVACLDAKTGRKLWLGDCGAGILSGTMYGPLVPSGGSGSAASDPLWYRGRLFVLTIGPASEQYASPLCLVELHPETGEVLSRQQILDTSERDKLPIECQASWAGGVPGIPGRLVVLVAGSVICCDLQGRIIWLRQETTLPYTTDSAFAQQYCQPAIESEGRLLVQQPGSCLIDCLAVDTGQRRWRRGIIGLQRIVDLPDDRLLARTARGLAALNKTTGEVLWQREFPGMLSALARTRGTRYAGSGLVLAVRQAMIDNKPQLVFLWIDPATGETRAHGTTPLAKNQPVYSGPIAARSDRTWCCFGFGAPNDSPTAENPKRIVELRPGGPAVADEAP